MQSLINVFQGWKTRRKMNRVFGRKADPYGYATHPHELAKQDLLISCLSGHHYPTALEVGCAEGIITERLAPLCDRLIAVDISEVALDRAKSRCQSHENIDFQRADIGEVLKDGTFDLIVASEVLYYLDPKHLPRAGFIRTLGDLARALRPNGRALLLHSFGAAAEKVVRQGYREEMQRAGLTLDFEIEGGNDPKKARYLISSLRRDA